MSKRWRWRCRWCGKSVQAWRAVCRSERCRENEAVEQFYEEFTEPEDYNATPPDPPRDGQ